MAKSIATIALVLTLIVLVEVSSRLVAIYFGWNVSMYEVIAVAALYHTIRLRMDLPANTSGDSDG
jgi:hypothetical protein